MKRPLLVLALFASSFVPAHDAQADTTVELENGVRVTFIPVPGVDRQTTITVLPLSYFDDPEGEVQRAHLIEHMMRRSTDPESDRPDGIEIEGDTSSTYAYVSTVAPREKWEEALLRHARWLRPSEWELGVFERELGVLESELAEAPDKGTRHRYALGAWSQVLRFGSEHVGMRSGLTSADEATLKDDVARRIPIGPEIQIYCMGPVAQSDQEKVLRREIGAMERSDAATSGAVELPDLDDELEATWDLPWRQLLLWYPVEESEPWHRIGAAMLTLRLNFRFSQHSDDELSNGLAYAVLVDPVADRPMIVISVVLPDGARAKDARKLIDKEIKDLPKSRGLAFRDQLQMLQPNPGFPSDIGSMIEQMKEWMSPEQLEEMERERGYMEYGMLRGRIDSLREFRMSREAREELAATIDVDDLEKLPKSMFHKKLRRELILAPAETE